tara:strand:+ start:57 stop:272 length:216 start_codon:yes stop_codon:yes gene_type:complete
MQYTENKGKSAMLSSSQVREIAYFLSEAAFKLATDKTANPEQVQGLATFAIEFNKYAHMSGALDSSIITEG